MKARAEIATARLTMYAPVDADADEIFRYASDPEATKYMAWPRHRSVQDTRLFLAFSASEWERSPAGPYVIRLKEGGQLIGSTGFHFTSADEAETGYILAREAWGRGYATEALLAMVEAARALGVRRLVAPFHPDNHASRRVLEKGGFIPDPDGTREVAFPNLDPGRLVAAPCYQLILAGPAGTQ